jgi:hypothetical protein
MSFRCIYSDIDSSCRSPRCTDFDNNFELCNSYFCASIGESVNDFSCLDPYELYGIFFLSYFKCMFIYINITGVEVTDCDQFLNSIGCQGSGVVDGKVCVWNDGQSLCSGVPVTSCTNATAVERSCYFISSIIGGGCGYFQLGNDCIDPLPTCSSYTHDLSCSYSSSEEGICYYNKSNNECVHPSDEMNCSDIKVC